MRAQTPPKKASPEDWHPADIVAALHKRGLSLRKLAAEQGVSGAVIIRALRRTSPRNEARIAAALGVHPMAIWPSRYAADGSVIERRGQPSHKAKRSTAGAAGKVDSRGGH